MLYQSVDRLEKVSTEHDCKNVGESCFVKFQASMGLFSQVKGKFALHAKILADGTLVEMPQNLEIPNLEYAAN